MTDITELAQLRGHTVDYPYYLVECDCGKIYPSSEVSGGEPMGDSGDYSDCYCPHCGEGEEHFAECADPETAWKAQQDKIDALVEALEKAYQQLAAENVALKSKGKELLGEACAVYSRLNKMIDPSIGDFVDGQTLHEFQFVLDAETPATDRIVAGIKADGVEEFIGRLQQCVDGGDFVGDEVAVIVGAIDCGKEFCEKLREGVDK